MKKLLITLLMLLCASIVYAQENSSNDLKADSAKQEESKSVENKSDTKAVKKQPDFNKKKISLDRIDEKKWSLRLGYAYFFPSSQYASIFANRLKVGGAYDINRYLQVQALLVYADGSKGFNVNGVNTNFSGTMYNLGAVVTGMYPVELSTGEIAPYGSLGGVYTFGNMKSTAGGIEQKQNLSGGAIIVQAGLQYSFNVFAFRVYGEYLHDFTPIKINNISNLSGISVGAEIGVKF